MHEIVQVGTIFTLPALKKVHMFGVEYLPAHSSGHTDKYSVGLRPITELIIDYLDGRILMHSKPLRSLVDIRNVDEKATLLGKEIIAGYLSKAFKFANKRDYEFSSLLNLMVCSDLIDDQHVLESLAQCVKESEDKKVELLEFF